MSGRKTLTHGVTDERRDEFVAAVRELPAGVYRTSQLVAYGGYRHLDGCSEPPDFECVTGCQVTLGVLTWLRCLQDGLLVADRLRDGSELIGYRAKRDDDVGLVRIGSRGLHTPAAAAIVERDDAELDDELRSEGIIT